MALNHYFVGLLLIGAFGTVSGLKCYNGDVETALAEPRGGYEVFGLDCGATQTACVRRNYTLTSFRLECYSGNCSRIGNRGQELDAKGLNTFQCCYADLCNILGTGASLNAVNLVVEGPEEEEVVQRPNCPNSYREWLYGEYKILAEGEIGTTTQSSELQGLIDTTTDDLRTAWTFGIQPPTVQDFIFTRDPSPPGCYTVSGFVKTGFCGPRLEYVIPDENAVEQVVTTRQVFDGKYQGKVCVGSKTEAISYSQDFTVVAKDNNFDDCFESLKASSLQRDCLQLGGEYNVQNLDFVRRALLPDCCSIYIHIAPATRQQCNCEATTLGPICAEVCCCESALLEEDEDEMCPKLTSYINTQLELEVAVNKQCCDTRMVSQCGSNSDCRDDGFEGGKLDRLHAAPMCCDYCEDFYDEICSYEGIQDGQQVLVSMKDDNIFPLLQAMCQQKQCSNQRPCSFSKTTRTDG